MIASRPQRPIFLHKQTALEAPQSIFSNQSQEGGGVHFFAQMLATVLATSKNDLETNP